MGLSGYKVVAGLAVSDMERAKEFYEGKLGLSVAIDSGDNLAYRCAEGSVLHVYLSPDHAGSSAARGSAMQMPDETTTVVICQQCRIVLGEPSDTTVQRRTSCPNCGSKARHFEIEVNATSTSRAGLRGKARTGQAGQPGGKPWLTTMSEPSWSYDRKKWVHREKTEDRKIDRYTEKVTDPDTGEVIHQADESLSDHRGHGSAKKKNNT